MSAPLVSIIIPCYNAERWVAEAIQSALDQTYAPTEVIVVDDGSTDGSLEVVRGFGSKVRCETGPNRGGNAARNRGLELAAGEIVQFLDADDVLAREKLARMVPLIDETDVVLCDWQRVTTEREPELVRPRLHHGHDVLGEIIPQIIGVPPIVRRATLLSIGGWDEALDCCQDYDLFVRLAAGGARFTHCGGEPLYTQRRQPGSVSSDNVKVHRGFARVMDKLSRILDETDAWSDERRLAVAVRRASSARWLMRLGCRQQGLQLLEKARQTHPDAIRQCYSPILRTLLPILGPWYTEVAAWGVRRRVQRSSSKTA